MAVFPKKLKKGDTIAVVAPALSLGIVSTENRDIAMRRFDQLGLKLVFGKHVEEMDEDFSSSSIQSRIDDLHWAFSDPSVAAVLTVIGGFNSNQLLDYIDWDLIHNNPKPLIGYSDITALQCAMLARSGVASYSGPGFASFAEKEGFLYTLEYFKKCLMEHETFEIKPSEYWSNDSWYIDQDNRDFIKNEGWQCIVEGEAEGILIGGNLCTLNLLQGTKYMPDLHGSILFIEDDHESKPGNFDRDLQSLLHLEAFRHVKGLVIGRFEKASEITLEVLNKIICSKRELSHIPVLAHVDFGHTTPFITFPIGGRVSIKLGHKSSITILDH